MKTEIFYYTEEQKSTALKLKHLLRTHMYPLLQPTMNDIAAYIGDASAEIGWRYVKLLQASIPPEKGIQVTLKSVSLLGYSSYIQVYYPFVYGSREFQTEAKKNFFPALAVRDRMVLVPKGLAELLEYPGEILAPFYPLGMGGVEEIDFNDESALDGALKRISEILHKEVFRELRAYATYRSFDKIDFAKLAEELDTEEGFIRHLCETMATENTSYRELTCELDQSNIQADRWTKVTLIIHNNSQVQLSNILVDIRGPAKILPTKIQTTIPPNSTQRVSVSLMPIEVGDFPLELIFVLPEDKAFTYWLPVHYAWLHCDHVISA